MTRIPLNKKQSARHVVFDIGYIISFTEADLVHENSFEGFWVVERDFS
jgi:hypothetical protein